MSKLLQHDNNADNAANDAKAIAIPWVFSENSRFNKRGYGIMTCSIPVFDSKSVEFFYEICNFTQS